MMLPAPALAEGLGLSVDDVQSVLDHFHNASNIIDVVRPSFPTPRGAALPWHDIMLIQLHMYVS